MNRGLFAGLFSNEPIRIMPPCSLQMQAIVMVLIFFYTVLSSEERIVHFSENIDLIISMPDTCSLPSKSISFRRDNYCLNS